MLLSQETGSHLAPPRAVAGVIDGCNDRAVEKGDSDQDCLGMDERMLERQQASWWERGQRGQGCCCGAWILLQALGKGSVAAGLLKHNRLIP